MSEEKYRFRVEWYDPTAKGKRSFVLGYYPSNGDVDMYDIAQKRPFLRKTRCDTVVESDLFIGNIVNVLSRQLYIVDFGDPNTAEKFSRDLESSILVVNESGLSRLGKIITVLEENDLNVYKGKMLDKDLNSFTDSCLSEGLKNRFVVLEARGEESRSIVRKLVYPDSPAVKPLKSLLGQLKEHCLAVEDVGRVEREVYIFFPPSREVHCNTATFTNSTCCLIRPHAVREGLSGKIIQDIIDAGFVISAFEMVTFNSPAASEFLEIYKGVVPEYKDMVSQMMTGPCIALEVTKDDRPVFTEFRTYVGPSDPDIAKKLRPGTLRSKYGTDKIKNAVHCTDLPEDATVELNYIFRILPA